MHTYCQGIYKKRPQHRSYVTLSLPCPELYQSSKIFTLNKFLKNIPRDASCASFSPFELNGTSTQPQNLLSLFQADSPWRTQTSWNDLILRPLIFYWQPQLSRPPSALESKIFVDVESRLFIFCCCIRACAKVTFENSIHYFFLKRNANRLK